MKYFFVVCVVTLLVGCSQDGEWKFLAKMDGVEYYTMSKKLDSGPKNVVIAEGTPQGFHPKNTSLVDCSESRFVGGPSISDEPNLIVRQAAFMACD